MHPQAPCSMALALRLYQEGVLIHTDLPPAPIVAWYINCRKDAAFAREKGHIESALRLEKRVEKLEATVAHAAFDKVVAACDDAAAVKWEEEDWDFLLDHLDHEVLGGHEWPRFTEHQEAARWRIAREMRLRQVQAAISPDHPDPKQIEILASKGYDREEIRAWGWAPHIVNTAEDCGCSISKAVNLWEMLGPSEAFDGFVTMLEDGVSDL